MSHAATTWQSERFSRFSVLPGPCQPIPITPTLMRLFGEVFEVCAAAPRRTVGRIAADPAVLRNRRRLNERDQGPEPDCSGIFYISVKTRSVNARVLYHLLQPP